MQDNIKKFVYFGAENYMPLSTFKTMVPAAYLFLSFTAAVAGIAGNALVPTILFLSFVAINAIVVYTFHLWCPQPSFACRFSMSAFGILSLGIILQSWAFVILHIGGYMDLWDIVTAIAVQILAAAVYILITKSRIKKGVYKEKKSFKTNVNIGLISMAVFAGRRVGRRLLGADSSVAVTLILMGITFVAALCAVLATMHLMRFYYCKKYDIICDEKGNKTSPLLFAEKKEKESLPKRILVTVCKVVLLLFLALTLVGVYMVSQQPPA